MSRLPISNQSIELLTCHLLETVGSLLLFFLFPILYNDNNVSCQEPKLEKIVPT